MVTRWSLPSACGHSHQLGRAPGHPVAACSPGVLLPDGPARLLYCLSPLSPATGSRGFSYHTVATAWLTCCPPRLLCYASPASRKSGEEGWECLVGPSEDIKSALRLTGPRRQGHSLLGLAWKVAVGPDELPQALLSAGRILLPPAGVCRPHLLARLPGHWKGVGQVWFTLCSQAPAPLCSWHSGRPPQCAAQGQAKGRDGGSGRWALQGPATDLCTHIGFLPPAAWHVTREPDAHGWLAGGTPYGLPIWHSCSTSTWHATHRDGPLPKTPACAPGPAPDARPAPGVRLSCFSLLPSTALVITEGFLLS